ncbi:H(+)-exporting diphosphatase [Forsythia ovata]|uniref:H(+)-exporting diphosphatase n=1 Tax=Forsythia ovata TaxID=205694 RepID=A0ABD1RZG7_9LAMI
MKIVGSTALKMVEEVCRQFNTIHILWKFICLSFFETFFGVDPLGRSCWFSFSWCSVYLFYKVKVMLPLQYCIQHWWCMGQHLTNSLRACKNPQPKRSEPHKAVIGYTIGYPLKDTPGLSFNILIKLMAESEETRVHLQSFEGEQFWRCFLSGLHEYNHRQHKLKWAIEKFGHCFFQAAMNIFFHRRRSQNSRRGAGIYTESIW